MIPSVIARQIQTRGGGLPPHYLSDHESLLRRHTRKATRNAGHVVPRSISLRQVAVRASRRSSTSFPRSSSRELRAVSSPATGMGAAGHARRAFDHCRHRHRVRQDRVLSLSDPRSLLPPARAARHQGDPDLSDECPGHRPGSAAGQDDLATIRNCVAT